jgi:DNA-binding NarL/FixJ family response regulator
MTEPIRVLLVDDQPLFRSGVAVTLGAESDLQVVGEASDGNEALELMEATQPDVVLMDIRMPDLDGVEATRRIFAPDAAARRERPVRVIVLTTFNLDDRAAAAIRYGASGFLLKDATPEFLAAAIRTVHAGTAVLAPDDLGALLQQQNRPVAALPREYQWLTDKEREVLAAVAEGLSNAEIAGRLYVSESTVKTHVGSILRKLGLRDRVQVVVFAYEHGLVP